MSWEYPITNMRFIKRHGDKDELRIRVEFADHFERPALKGLRQDDSTININALDQPVFAYFDHAEKIEIDFGWRKMILSELLPLLDYDKGSELAALGEQILVKIREHCQDATWSILQDYDANKSSIKVE